MKILQNDFSPERFYKRLGSPVSRVLFLDYDGTLAPFTRERTRAFPYKGIIPLLNRIIENNHTRVVIVTGREVYAIRELLPLSRIPEIWGSHGFERLLPDNTYTFFEQNNSPSLKALSTIDDLAKTFEKRIEVENKPASRAFHFRGIPETAIDNVKESLYAFISPVAKRGGLLIKEFDGGVEVSAPGRDKGYAVRSVLAEMPEGTVSAYLGDDTTDEDAFRELCENHDALSVLVRKEQRRTTAKIWITPPDELIGFLENWHKTARDS